MQDERVPAWTLPEYTSITEWLEGAERIWLPLHVSPDGDCLGSNLPSHARSQLRGYSCLVVSTDPIPDVYAPFYKPERCLHR